MTHINWSFIFPNAILLLAYISIVLERIPKVATALLGASILIVSHCITQQQAISSIDFNVIFLLVGMMIIVNVLGHSGGLNALAIFVARTLKGDKIKLLLIFSLMTAVLSAIFDNVTTVLLLGSVTCVIAQHLKVSPVPFLISETICSNIGGTATLIGDPPNIMIGSAVGLSFTDFISELGPVVVCIHFAVLLVIYLLWTRQLTSSPEARARVMAFDARGSITDTVLLRQSLAVMATVITGFIVGEHFGLQSGSVALGGAALLMLLFTLGRTGKEQSARVQEVLAELEWGTILFFMCLFMMVHGLKASGVLTLLGQQMVGLTGGDLQVTAFATLWLAATASAVIDNVPFVATMIPVLQSTTAHLGGTEQMAPVWWALSLGACLGGNGTLVGATANIIVAGFAERAGQPISFGRFLLLGLPVLLLSTIIASGYLYLRHFA